VVEFVVRGASTRQISQALYVTEDTVQKHLQNVFEKVGDRSRQELIKRRRTGPTVSTPSRSGSSSTRPMCSSESLEGPRQPVFVSVRAAFRTLLLRGWAEAPGDPGPRRHT
jgi:hypothetical protein